VPEAAPVPVAGGRIGDGAVLAVLAVATAMERGFV
jgi:hypothetical protein